MYLYEIVLIFLNLLHVQSYSSKLPFDLSCPGLAFPYVFAIQKFGNSAFLESAQLLLGFFSRPLTAHSASFDASTSLVLPEDVNRSFAGNNQNTVLLQMVFKCLLTEM